MKEGKKESDRRRSRTGVVADLHANAHLRPRGSVANVCWQPSVWFNRTSLPTRKLHNAVPKCPFKTRVPVSRSDASTQLSQLAKMLLASISTVVSSQVDPNRSKSVVDNADKNPCEFIDLEWSDSY